MVRVKISPDGGGYYEGWKRYGILGTFAALIGLAAFPIMVDPMLNVDKYKRIQEITEQEIAVLGDKPEPVLKPWSDPFKRPSKTKKEE